ncbi:protein transport protein sft2 [Myotisia sp. PD_48]|nr:protein transport protein sft2 [Myotisia sp. PD_48]
MASRSFNDSINSLGWSRRAPDAQTSSTPFLSRIQAWNPLAGDGYVRLGVEEGSAAPLPAPTRREEEEGWFALSRWDRILIFAGCNVGALACFVLCFVLFPVLTLKPRKFAILWSVGSVLFLVSWAVLMGVVPYFKHLTSGPRLPFTLIYFSTIGLTLYFAVGLHSTILTLISSIFQLLALIWYLVTYFPLGSTGLRMVARVGGGRVTAWMND